MIVKTKLGYVFLYNKDETALILRSGSCVDLPVSEVQKGDMLLLKMADEGVDTVSERYAEDLGRLYSSKIKVFESEKSPTHSFICRVENQDDLNELSDCIGQKLTKNTKRIYYPLKETLRSKQGTARIKVKRRAVMILFGDKFMEDLGLDFKKGVRIWFDPESVTLKIGMSEGSELNATSFESQQCIYIGKVLKFFGFEIKSTVFNLPIEVNDDKTLSVRLESHAYPIGVPVSKKTSDQIPESIINGSQKVVRSFLRALFDRDFDSVGLNFRCASPLLLHQVRFLLYKLKIVTALDQKPHTDEAGFWDTRQAKIVEGSTFGEYRKDLCDQVLDIDFKHEITNFDRMYHSFLVVDGELQNNFDFDDLDKANKAKFCVKKRAYDWTHEWLEMPEYVHSKKEPYAEVAVTFNHEATYIELSKKLKQKITGKTRSVWFPERPKAGYSHLRWKSES